VVREVVGAAEGMATGGVVAVVTGGGTVLLLLLTAVVLLLLVLVVALLIAEVASVVREAIALATLLLSLLCSFNVLTIVSVLIEEESETAGDLLPLLFFFDMTSL